MYEVLSQEELSAGLYQMKIAAPAVAGKAQAGQFVVVIADDKGERIPLTLADWDGAEGSITLVFLAVGTSTHKLGRLGAGQSLAHVVGPLGQPTHIENFGTVVIVGGGVGIAAIAPIARALKEAGNRVVTIMGSRTRELLFWEERLARVSDELIVTTDDGSYGRRGVVTVPLEELLRSPGRVGRVFAVGPTVMMKFCAQTTRPYQVNTIVSLNPIMVDGTGMCGCCRVVVAGQTRFACVDGPDFDGHQVDWELLATRQRAYLEQERHSLELLERQLQESRAKGGNHPCRS